MSFKDSFRKIIAESADWDYDTPSNYVPNGPTKSPEEIEKFKQEQMKQNGQKAYLLYPGKDYQNKWNKVSPLNIILKDNLNEAYAMTPQQAAEFVANKIKELNDKLGYPNGQADDSYDYVSEGYIETLKQRMSKCPTIDKAMEVFTNAVLEGMGMGMSKKKRSASVEAEIESSLLEDRETLEKMAFVINAFLSLKK